MKKTTITTNRKQIPWFTIAVGTILLVAAFLRFYNYNNHWGLAIDQAHDALVARSMLQTGKIPFLGPFSSAGEFQMSGIWYWLIAIGTLPYPGNALTPWIVLTLGYVMFVYMMIRFGTELIDKKFGLLLGLLTAVSPAQIGQSVNLTQQSAMTFTPLIALWFSIRYIRTKKLRYLFWVGFFVSLGASLHLQGAPLIFLILFTLIFGRKLSLRHIAVLGLGCVIPILTIIIFDIGHNFWVIRGMMKYYFVDKYKIPLEVLGRRWLTYLGVFVPTEWGKIFGGNIYAGGLLAISSYGTIAYLLLKRKIQKEVIMTALVLGSVLAMVKYTRTPLFSSFIVALHPFILTMSSWVLYELWKRTKWFGGIVILIFIMITLQVSWIENVKSTNMTSLKARQIVRYLYQTYPNAKFDLYDYKYQDALYSLATSMYMDADQRIDKNGTVIAFASRLQPIPADWKVMMIGDGLPLLVEVPKENKQTLIKPNWNSVTPAGIYHDAVDWR